MRHVAIRLKTGDIEMHDDVTDIKVNDGFVTIFEPNGLGTIATSYASDEISKLVDSTTA